MFGTAILYSFSLITNIRQSSEIPARLETVRETFEVQLERVRERAECYSRSTVTRPSNRRITDWVTSPKIAFPVGERLRPTTKM